MRLAPSVLLTLGAPTGAERSLGERLAGWIADLGFRACVTADAAEARRRLEEERHAASFVDSALAAPEGPPLWRTLRYAPRTPVVLMARLGARVPWSEALARGVATVLPWPPRVGCVRAALLAACGPLPWQTPRESCAPKAPPPGAASATPSP